MNIKDFILPLAFALAGTLLIQYFFSGEKQVAIETSNRRFTAPETVQVSEPFDLTIGFNESSPTRASEDTLIPLPTSRIQFSNDGAVVNYIGYTRDLGGKQTLVETLGSSTGVTRDGSFLVVLDGPDKTPYYYTLVDKKEESDRTILIYRGESPAAVITKQFTVHHTDYTIDLALTIDPKIAEGVRPRIFFTGPHVAGDAKDIINTVLAQGSSLEKAPIKDMTTIGVERPTIFGLEDTYFAQLLYKDPDQFAQRAYFKYGGETAQAVLQSNLITQKKSWNLSFYSGPKELTALSHIDSRLEGLLAYGWFFYISKYMLYILIFLYGIVKNYGVAIIILTILVRLLLVPFTLQAEQTKKRNSEVQKKLQYLDQRYKDDPEALTAAKGELMRKHGLPGALGCLPLLLQIPVFIGLQRVLSNAIELYQAPFLWISDLAAPDPYYILPLIAGGSMIGMMSQDADAKQFLINGIMAIVFAAFTANISAGLTLFIAVSSLAGLVQNSLQKAFAR